MLHSFGKRDKILAATWRPGSKVGLLYQLRKANSEQTDAVGVNTGRGGSKPPPYEVNLTVRMGFSPSALLN